MRLGTKRAVIPISILLLGLIPWLLAGGCIGGGVEGVTVQEIAINEFKKTVTGVGKLEACDPYYVLPGATGPISELHVSDGDRVEAGQVLASIDRGVLEEELREAEANYLTQSSMGDLMASLFSDMSSVFAAVNSSLDTFDGYRAMFETTADSYYELLVGAIRMLPPEQRGELEEVANRVKQQSDDIYSQVESPPRVSGSGYPGSAAQADEARSEVAGEQYEEARRSLDNADIVAPVSGNVFFMPSQGLLTEDMVSNMQSDVGGFTSSLKFLGGGVEEMFDDVLFDLVMPQYELRTGSRVAKGEPAFMIVDLDRASVSLKIEEADIALVEVGQGVEVTVDALPGETLKGEVVHVARRAALSLSDDSMYEVTVAVESGGRELRLGYTATGIILVEERESAVLIPLEAVITEPSPHVFVEKEGKAVCREVVLGLEEGDRVEVREGLQEGERVVIEGASKVEEGDGL